MEFLLMVVLTILLSPIILVVALFCVLLYTIGITLSLILLLGNCIIEGICKIIKSIRGEKYEEKGSC